MSSEAPNRGKPPARPVGRPRDERKRLAIVDAGFAHFLRHGVAATRLEQVAAEAGVSKATLYANFPDKAALFEAAMRHRMRAIESRQSTPGAGAPLRETLERFGVGIMTYLASPEAVDFYNVLAGELRRHPELARVFYNNGPGQTKANLAALLRLATLRGELRLDDPETAAEELFGLWQGFSNFTLALAPVVDDSAIARRVARGVDIFLAIYGAGEIG